MNKRILLTILLMSTTACTTSQPKASDPYLHVVEKYSSGDMAYEGAYNNFDYRATLLNTVVQQAFIDKKAEIYLWDEQKKQTELTKIQADNTAKTRAFLSFYTPIRQDDNMATKRSIWSVYLQTSKGRFEGKVLRNRENRSELYAMFPYHQRYNSAYEVTFDVPLVDIENEKTSMIIAGPLGQKTVEFPGRTY